MGLWLPPYVNKHEKALAKRLNSARKKEESCKRKYDTAVEYTRLCREALENAKK